MITTRSPPRAVLIFTTKKFKTERGVSCVKIKVQTGNIPKFKKIIENFK